MCVRVVKIEQRFHMCKIVTGSMYHTENWYTLGTRSNDTE